MAKTSINKIPNIITIIRIFLMIPIVSLLIYVQIKKSSNFNYQDSTIWAFYSAFALFLIASFSDYLDGKIARAYKISSTFGKIFDPIADKILINITLVAFVGIGIIPWFFVVVFIARDIVVDGCRIVIVHHKIEVGASIWGKAKTLMQIIAISILFIFSPMTGGKEWVYWVLNIPIVIAIWLSNISAFLYIKPIWKYLFKPL
ncbi:CDP-diacylglycerol--glycerol-3-phosphate 3-phosphatidyltransferase [Mesomycoplasma conjunctivae]|uniref:CDP-diacylglycerol--glycerol-3-phosphate 3-phosphatidyltransferase n=1 Tax=Mesomycoplasma conjunctivae TaxID=45361 RepID=UPI003DA21D32